MATFRERVIQELKAMKDIGMRVPDNAFKLVETDRDVNDPNCNMTATEAADLILDHANLLDPAPNENECHKTYK